MAAHAKSSAPPIGPHDLGGAEAGAVDREDRELAYWERQVDTMLRVLEQKGFVSDAAELRDGIEQLGPGVYENYSYYERWSASIARICVRKGLVTQDELDARTDALMKAQGRAAGGSAGGAA